MISKIHPVKSPIYRWLLSHTLPIICPFSQKDPKKIWLCCQNPGTQGTLKQLVQLDGRRWNLFASHQCLSTISCSLLRLSTFNKNLTHRRFWVKSNSKIMVFLFVFFWLLLVCLAGWGSSQDRNERLEIGHCSQVKNQSEDQFATQGKVKCSVCKTNKSRAENYIFHEMLHECFSKSGTPKAIHTIWFDDDDDIWWYMMMISLYWTRLLTTLIQCRVRIWGLHV